MTICEGTRPAWLPTRSIAAEADILLVRVVGLGDTVGMLSMMQVGIELLARESDEPLKAVAYRLRGAGRRALTKRLIGYPATEILAYEEETKPDLVVMATHGRGDLNRLMIGSVAERVVQAGTVPVLMVRPHGAAMTETLS